MADMRTKLDRPLVVGGLLAIVSAALLSAGLFTIFSTLSQERVDLASRGSLEEILRDARDTSENDDLVGAPDAGFGRDDLPPSEASIIAAPADSPPTASPHSPTPSPAPTRTPVPIPSPPPCPPEPVAIAIPRLEIEAPVVAMGLDAERYPEVPDGPHKVAWYTFTSAPGRSTNAVFAAHFDWVDRFGEGMEGVFYELHDLDLGDVISISLDDASVLTYEVTANVAVPYDDPDVLTLMEATTNDVITLITCGGTWQRDPESRYRGNYSHRIIVRAERAVPGGLGEGE